VVQESVLNMVDSKDLVVHVVWTPVLESDDHGAAVESHRKFLQDPRAVHYWDGDQDLGLLYGKLLALPRGRTLAWDIYLVFGPGTRWSEEAPLPADWAHQLGRDERYLGGGEGYRRAIEALLKKGLAPEARGSGEAASITVAVDGMMKSRSGAT
jgi:hypothetical protein